jgi:hypothetical protein
MRIFYFQGISFSRTCYPITRCEPAEELKEKIRFSFLGYKKALASGKTYALPDANA